MNKMSYRNYTAVVEYDAVDRIFVGHLLGIRDKKSINQWAADVLHQAALLEQ